jgi:quercetin dioxygenase-like cupin family protein
VIRRFDHVRFRWSGIEPAPYQSPAAGGRTWRDVERFVLVGREAPTAFHLRYFELAPRGFSSLERHSHAHAVLVVRGRGRVRLGPATRRVGPMDFIFIPPGLPHQFRAGRERFGFLCPVDAQRDRPKPVPGVGSLRSREHATKRRGPRTGRRRA